MPFTILVQATGQTIICDHPSETKAIESLFRERHGTAPMIVRELDDAGEAESDGPSILVSTQPITLSDESLLILIFRECDDWAVTTFDDVGHLTMTIIDDPITANCINNFVEERDEDVDL